MVGSRWPSALRSGSASPERLRSRQPRALTATSRRIASSGWFARAASGGVDRRRPAPTGPPGSAGPESFASPGAESRSSIVARRSSERGCCSRSQALVRAGVVLGVEDRLVVAADHQERGERGLAPLRLLLEDGEQAVGRLGASEPAGGLDQRRRPGPCRRGRRPPGRGGRRRPRGSPRVSIAWIARPCAFGSADSQEQADAGPRTRRGPSWRPARSAAALADGRVTASRAPCGARPRAAGSLSYSAASQATACWRSGSCAASRAGVPTATGPEPGDQELGRLDRQVVLAGEHRLLEDGLALRLGRPAR